MINIKWAKMTIYMNQADSNEDAKHFDFTETFMNSLKRYQKYNIKKKNRFEEHMLM